jgi:hypothetical protein
MTRRVQTPLAAWLVSALLVLGGIGSLYYLKGSTENQYRSAFIEAQRLRLNALQERLDGPLIVALGNSLLRQASSSAEITSGKPWLRVVNHRNPNLIALWPLLRQNRPALLIVQLELLMPKQSLSENNINTLPGDLLHLAPQLLSDNITDQSTYNTLINNVIESQQRNECHPARNWERVARKLAKNRDTRYQTLSTDTDMLAAIREASRFSDHVLLLDVPRSGNAERLLGEHQIRWHEFQIAQFNDLPNVHFARLGAPLADDCYCDYRHVLPQCQSQLEAPLATIIEGIVHSS